MKKSNLVRRKYELTCLSPVHIGSGEKLKAYEYMYDRNEQEVYFLDEGRWISFLGEKRLMDDFSKYLERTVKAMQGDTPFRGENLWEWLSSKGFSDDEIKALGIRCAKAVTNTIVGKKGSLNDLVCHIALADGRPYIPGSTLKGTLRTGMLYGLMQRQKKELFEKTWMDVSNLRFREKNGIKRAWNAASKQLETLLLRKLTSDVTKDVLRGFSVSDAMPVDSSIETVILQKIDVSTTINKSGQSEKKLPLFRECIPTGTKFIFDISMDLSIMEEIEIVSTDEVIAMTREFIQHGLNYQEGVFGKEYRSEFQTAKNADLILGGGTGFLTKSLIYTIAPSRKAGCRVVSSYLDDAFPRHRHKTLDSIISPRTMKITQTQQGRNLMGLCSLREISSC